MTIPAGRHPALGPDHRHGVDGVLSAVVCLGDGHRCESATYRITLRVELDVGSSGPLLGDPVGEALEVTSRRDRPGREAPRGLDALIPTEVTDGAPGSRSEVDFGDLLIAVADNLDEIRRCVGCGDDSTWAGLFVDDQGLVSVTAWCDAVACVHDRVVLSAGNVLAVPIHHLPELRRKAATS